MANDTPRLRFFWFALLALIVWLPLPLGSNRPWSAALLTVASLTLLSLWGVRYALAPYRLPAAWAAARPALLWGVAWVGYGGFQLVPLPSAWVAWLSPRTAWLYQQAHAALNLPPPAWLPLSVDVEATGLATGAAAAYLSLFALVLILAQGSHRIRALVWVLLVGAAANAAYGLIVAFEGAESAWRITPYLGHSMVSGTYVNRNHFAGLMILTLPLGLGLLRVEGGLLGHAATWRARWADWVAFSLSAGGRLFFLCLLIMLGLVFSNSRGGLLALGGALLGLTLLLRYQGERRASLFLFGGLGLLGIALLWLGDGGLGARLSQQGFSDAQRPLLWADTLRYSSDFWLFGSGAGTFRWTFPAYKSAVLGPALFEHAHNDYLETLAESGLIGSVLLLGFSLAVLRSLLRVPRHSAAARYLALGALTAAGALLLQGLVDFNLHIPANAAYFYVVLGLGLAAAARSQDAHAAA